MASRLSASVVAVVAILVVAATARADVSWSARDGAPVASGEDLAISQVTFGPGDDVTEWFGHSAIIVVDTTRNIQRLYNFGEFRFDDTMLARYVSGHLTFSVGARSVPHTLALYAERNRSITVEPLLLTPAERLAYAVALDRQASPEHRHYRYDHYTDNCATRPRDLLDVVLGGQLAAIGAVDSGSTLRAETRRMTVVSPVMAFLIDLVLNGDVDAPLSQLGQTFLPDRLQGFYATTTIRHDDGSSSVLLGPANPLLGHLSTRAPVAETPPRLAPWCALIGLLIGAAMVGRNRLSRVVLAVVGVVAGLLGTALVAGWVATDHLVVHHNANLLLCSPLALLWPFFSTTRASATRGPLALAAAMLLGVVGASAIHGLGGQDLSWTLPLFAPLWLLAGVGVWRRR